MSKQTYFSLKKRVMKPDATKHNPDPVYLREVLDRTIDPETQKPYSQRKAAKIIGVTERAMRYYMLLDTTDKTYRPAPYPVQFSLECLAEKSDK